MRLEHDAGGNFTSDGVRTYTWNARHHLVSVKGPGLDASFAYDGRGRRTRKRVNGVDTSVVYDGWTIAQERTDGAKSAAILPSMWLDE